MRHVGNHHLAHFVLFLDLPQFSLDSDVSESHHLALGVVEKQWLHSDLDCLFTFRVALAEFKFLDALSLVKS